MTGIAELLQAVRRARAFDAASWLREKTVATNEYFRRAGASVAVVNMSGGVDSSVTFALLAHAKAQPDSPIRRVVGITQPIHSTAKIQNRALLMAGKGELIEVDQTTVYDRLVPLVEDAIKLEGTDFARGQLRSYMRTPVAYFVAQLLSAHGQRALVVGTGNFDEDGYLYYFCKAGDGISDVQLIADLHKSEVISVGRLLDVPHEILDAVPSADLYEGQTDEGELGFSYDMVELFTELLKRPELARREVPQLSDDAFKTLCELEAKILRVHNANKHKEDYPVNINVLETPSLFDASIDLKALRE